MGLIGRQEVSRTLRRIVSSNQNASRNAAAAGARYLRTEEKKAAPRDSGRGVKTIYAKRHRGRPGEGRSTVEVSRRGFYLKILEVGAKAHRIAVKGRHPRALAIGKGRGVGHGLIMFRHAVQIPALRARPWFGPTFTRARPRILAEIQKSYAENLAKQIQKKGL